MPAADAPLRAFWCRIPSRPNFGDFVGPWLVKRITGRYPRFVNADDPRGKHLVGGSIIAYAGRASAVWGCGIISRDDVISPHATLHAVRGPLTRRRALECGASCPPVLGDPALLLPRYHRPPPGPRHGLGVVAHFSDMPALAARWRPRPDARLIDVQDPIESVIDRIAASEVVASSSLHGLIASHAYGVPAVWVEFRPLPSGDRSKFHDYLASIGHHDVAPVQIGYGGLDSDALARRAIVPAVALDAEPLWRACPFRP